MSERKINFRESQSSFIPAKRLNDEDWFDTSFSQSPKAVGLLRLPIVNNGRYENKHPILNENGDTVGFMPDGVGTIGYTYRCVYAGGCFWIAHMTFGSTLNGGKVSNVSLVDATGTFLFSNKTKFKKVKSFGFGGGWTLTIKAFKLLDDGAYLLYLTTRGVCLFDTRAREIVAKADFTYGVFGWSDFVLSPKVKLLAIVCSEKGEKNLIDGEYHHKNFIRIYDLETGVVVAEQVLPDEQKDWSVDFSEDGRNIGVTSGSTKKVFELTAS